MCTHEWLLWSRLLLIAYSTLPTYLLTYRYRALSTRRGSGGVGPCGWHMVETIGSRRRTLPAWQGSAKQQSTVEVLRSGHRQVAPLSRECSTGGTASPVWPQDFWIARSIVCSFTLLRLIVPAQPPVHTRSESLSCARPSSPLLLLLLLLYCGQIATWTRANNWRAVCTH